MPNRQILFNHIPKTGGVTLRIILNRFYGEKNIFLIKSTDVAGSLRIFKGLSSDERRRFAVVAGHGAELFVPYVDNPVRVTILRNPVSLFLSQYHYLKHTRDAGFYEALKGMESLEEYLEFAIKNGQDNLLTRYLSGSVHFLADAGLPIPDMLTEGGEMLERAVKAMQAYEVVIDLDDFDAGVFAMARKLGWKYIPVYRPANRNRLNPGMASLKEDSLARLRHALEWDISLYDTFKEERIACGNRIDRGAMAYNMFTIRQKGISLLSKLVG